MSNRPLSDEERRLLDTELWAAAHTKMTATQFREYIWRAATAFAYEQAIATVRRYLVYDSQRAVSWHEIQDCIEKLREPIKGAD